MFPGLAELNMGIMVASFIIILATLPSFAKRSYRNLSEGKTVYVLLIFLTLFSGFFIRGFLVENSLVQYRDESFYLDEAKNFVRKGAFLNCADHVTGEKCYSYPDANGFPFLVSIIFGIIGFNPMKAVWINVLLGSLSVLLVGLLGTNIFDVKTGALSAFLFSLLSFHVKWSSTAEKTVSAVFFTLIFLNSAYMVFKDFDWSLLFLTVSSYLFAGFTRLELFLFLLPVILLVLKDSEEVENFLMSGNSFLRVSGFSMVSAAVLLSVFKQQLYAKIFVLGSGGASNAGRMGFTALFKNLLVTYSDPVKGLTASVLGVFFITKGAGRKFLERRNIFLGTGLLYMSSFMFFGGSDTRMLILPLSIGFVYFSKGLTEFFEKGNGFGKTFAVISSLFLVILMFSNTINIDNTGYDEIVEGFEQDYQGCNVFTDEPVVFSFSENVFVFEQETMFENKELLHERFDETCTIYIGDSINNADFEGEVIAERIGEEEYENTRFEVYNLTMENTEESVETVGIKDVMEKRIGGCTMFTRFQKLLSGKKGLDVRKPVFIRENRADFESLVSKNCTLYLGYKITAPEGFNAERMKDCPGFDGFLSLYNLTATPGTKKGGWSYF